MQRAPFKVIGISVKTTNQNMQAAKDIGTLWGRFMKDEIMSKIPNKVSHDLYCIYTDYEGNYTQPYRTILGCMVSSLDEIPEGLEGYEIPGGEFQKFTAQGDPMEGAVGQKWQEIWDQDQSLDRLYTADYQIHTEDSLSTEQPEKIETEIFIAIR